MENSSELRELYLFEFFHDKICWILNQDLKTIWIQNSNNFHDISFSRDKNSKKKWDFTNYIPNCEPTYQPNIFTIVK